VTIPFELHCNLITRYPMKIHSIIIVSLLLAACGRHEAKMDMKPGTFASAGLKTEEETESVYDEITAEAPASQQPVQTLDRKLIRNGTLHFRTKAVKATKTEIEKQVKALHGYISNESQNDYDNGLSYEQTLRVPAAHFDTLIQKIETLAQHIDNRTINTDDVTEEFIDVETRLITKKDLEKRYRELLAKGRTVEELLSIERELSNVRGEIESMEGRLNYLKNQVGFSTLVVTYYEQNATEFGFGSKVMASFGEGWSNLLYFFIGVLNIWPFVIVVVVAGWWWMRSRKRKKNVDVV